MATPAEIIAARVNGTYLGDSIDSSSDSNSNFELNGVNGSDNQSSTGSSAANPPSIADESAFPTLGGKKSSNGSSASAPSWGPGIKNSVSNNAISGSGLKAGSPVAAIGINNGKFKASTIQDAFSLDAEDQLNVARPEFIKILTNVKAETNTNIECTTSQHTKKRTFLITGKPEKVKQAKRVVIKKLTKPISVAFTIPAAVRFRIIGQQGRTIKSIIQENEVKIDVGNPQDTESNSDDDDDAFAQTVNVTIEGDVEGCKHAKAQILAIVKEETKNLSTRVTIDDLVKPFVSKAISPVIAKYPDLDISAPSYNSSSSKIVIVGDREEALEAKDEIKDIVSTLSTKIVTEEVPIPKVKHQFLPVDSVLEEHNILIQLPRHGESSVKFIGEKKKLAFAKESARKTTSQYNVEVLDMAKAHKGNLPHVKSVAALLSKNGSFEKISNEHDVSVNAPSIKSLRDSSIASIPIEIVVKGNDVEKTKATKKSIVTLVNKITPEQTKVVSDIDQFLINQVPKTIDEVAFANNISYVILGKNITLFSNEESEETDFDFVDTTQSSEGFNKVDEALNKLRELAANLESLTLSVPTDEVFIHGIKSEVNKIKKDIESILSDAKEYKDGFKTTFEVPSSVLSRIIGKGGNAGNDKSTKSEITITGAKKNAEEAKADILSSSKRFADESLERLRIENQYHRRIIGPNFSYINRLQDKYNVKIRFPSADNTPSTFADAPKSKDEVTIKGPSKGVAKAVEELKELHQFEKENGFKQTIQVPTKAVPRVIGKSGETIRDIADGSGVEYRFNRSNNSEEELGYAELELTGSKSALKEAAKKINDIVDEIENFVSISINVNPKYHRDLIGQGGSVMREIISKAGGADVPRNRYYKLLTIPNEGSGSDEVTSQGDKAIVNKIIEQIKDIVALKEASIIAEYELPKEKHRLIIGPGGSIRSELQKTYETSIDIPRPNDQSTIVKLAGLPDKIEALKAKLDEITKDDWNVSIDVPERYHSLVSEKGAIFKKLKNDYKVEVQHGTLTRLASKLSGSASPNPPEEALPENNEKTKFTISSLAEGEISETVIPWRLKGEEKDTKKAAELINQRLENAKNASAAAWFYSANPSSFTKVVGPLGSVVNGIRSKTNTFITVPRSNEKNSNFIYLVGSPDNLKLAEESIKSLL
ncbi:hypothetical protein QCA50_018163 [Cerrena zonata]|uniref:K Homology domain-containing protein n=1 Tax=Cerrena zonata TaxID=2478898 RepID=A0AAW0FE33_9APHY